MANATSAAQSLLNNIPRVLQGFNLFVDGKGFAAKVSECELPKLAIKAEEYQLGGYDAPIEVDCGMEKMETTFTLLDFDPYTLKYFGIGHNNQVPVTLRGAIANGDGTVVPVVIQYNGMWREVEPPKHAKPGKLEQKVTMTLQYYKLEIGGEIIHEIDIPNMVRIIAGTDYLAAARAAIGV